MRSLAYIFSLCLFVAVARAQSVSWEPAGGSLAHKQTSELQLVFDSCEPTAEPVVPGVSGLALQRTGEMRSTNIVNGRISQTVRIGFAALPSTKDRLTIPSFTVETNKGRLTVAAASFDVGQATVGQSGISLDSVATAKLTAPREVWAGEIFPLVYDLSILRRYAHSLGGNLEWNPAPLSIEEWSKPEQREAVVNGENRIVVSQATRAVARGSGPLALNTGNQLVNVVKGTDMWGRANLDQFAITSERPQITVKPLPPGAPASFKGAVGKFTLDAKVIPTTANVGEPITWTLNVEGTGNWPDISAAPIREASKDFRTIQPQAKRTNKEGALFEGTLSEDVVLIPTKPGTYSLGPTTWTFFDPAKGSYQTVTSPAVSVTINALPVPPSVGGASPSPHASDSATPLASKTPTAPPAALTPIPRDPLPGTAKTFTPLDTRTLILWLAAPLAPLLVFWLWLALRRAKKTDPLVPQREAGARLAATLAQLQTTTEPAKVSALLQAWQRDTAILWQLPKAVPAPADFQPATVANGVEPLPVPQADVRHLTSPWAILWADAERSLYRADTPLPADWVKRAQAALAERPVKAFSVVSLFLPRNLLPFAAALIVCLHIATPPLSAQPANDAYAKADFPAAEKAWRERLAKTPTDWRAHHNLALALAQQNRWGESAAHAAAAFTQHPDDPSVRWHLALALERAGYAPKTFTAFVTPSPLHNLARRYSPAEWQRILIAGSALICIAIALLLIRAYTRRTRALAFSAAFIGVLAVATIAASALSLRLYSITGDARAVLAWKASTLRSIPTEADTTQKTSPLPAGSLAIVEKPFLNGWVRLAFPNGQTGWARSDDLCYLWR